ncbi:eukaryotic translation initiation factor 4 gamma [Drosophila eugracilis]|uniref:eukaryotic translation initiation factor 4 gamma n=1 Tax=Drosophila eugracilis TaxID=29029 RepID=UPI001BDA35CC|nr:eukaryotic translation initiation factor 4 gamma [Drosophila eugracilis]
METVGPNTRLKMLLLLLWVLLWGPSAFGSPLEIQLLDLMLREAEGYPSNGRSQRDIDVLPAASIGCDDSGSQEEFSNLFDDYEESKEDCLEFLPPCEPSFQDGLPIDHPCFVKLLLLRTPLLKQDPCANFSLIAENPITTTVKPKSKKCNPRRKAKKSGKENVLLGLPNNRTLNSTTNAPIISTTTTEPNSKIINIRKLVPRVKPNTTSTTTSTTTTLETTTVEETTTPKEETTEEPLETTTELEITTTPPSTTSTTTTTQPAFTANQLKRLKTFRERQKSSRRKSPNVPDPPQIKLDNVSQPSEVIQVIMTTEAAELKLKPEVNTTTTVVPTTTVSTSTSKPETTTVESCEDEVETIKVPENSGCEDDEASDQSENKLNNTTEEPCEDTDEQDTNLCPQFMPTQGAAPPRPPPPYRFRKPVKNYVEPILYEGNFAKPLQRMPPMGPQQRDYFVTNKQIVPRPRPKYRKRIPPSIYMNNIVRGMDCSDEVSQTPNQPQMSWDGGLIPRSQSLRKIRPERNMRSFAPTPIRRNPSYPRSSEEMMERQYQRERHPDPRPQYHHFPEDEVLQEERSMPPATPTPNLDPCQQEHDHILYSQRPHRQQTEHLVDYPQPPTSSHFFT